MYHCRRGSLIFPTMPRGVRVMFMVPRGMRTISVPGGRGTITLMWVMMSVLGKWWEIISPPLVWKGIHSLRIVGPGEKGGTISLLLELETTTTHPSAWLATGAM